MKLHFTNKRYGTVIALGLAGLIAGSTGCTKSNKASLPEKSDTTPAAQVAAPVAAPADSTSESTSAEAAAPGEATVAVPAVPAAAPAATLAPAQNLLQAKGVHVVSGQVFARQSASVGFQVSGFIKSLDKDAGDVVAQGDVLATLDDTDAALTLQVAEARLEQAKAAFTNAKSEFDREKQLQSASASSGSSFDLRRSAFEQAKAARDLAELEVKRSGLALERTKLKAPFPGIISSRTKDVSEQVNPGAEVFTMVSNEKHEVRMQVPEQLLRSVKLGQKIAINIPSIGVKTEAEVTRIVPVISDKSRSFLMYAQLAADLKEVTPGLFVEGQITLDGSH